MITSLKNPRVKLVRALQTNRRARARERLYVVEGRRLLEEVDRTAVAPLTVLHHDHLGERDRGVVNRLARRGATIEVVSDEVLAACSATETASGLLAVLPFQNLSPPPEPSLVLICDRIGDPGNMGAVLRTAEAAGVDMVLAAPGTVDIYNPKVVRGGAGAHLRLPVLPLDWNAIRAAVVHCECLLASSHSGVPYDAVDWTRRSALIVSSETGGSGEQARALAHADVHIPMASATESLNVAVAAGVLLMEAARQRRGAATAPHRLTSSGGESHA